MLRLQFLTPMERKMCGIDGWCKKLVGQTKPWALIKLMCWCTFSFSNSSRFSFSQLSPNRLTSLRSLSLFSVATSNCCLSSLFTSTRVLFLSCCSSNRTFHCWSSPRWRSCKAIRCNQKYFWKFQKFIVHFLSTGLFKYLPNGWAILITMPLSLLLTYYFHRL